MDSEKELLKQDLNKQESPEDVKQFIEDAKLLGHEDIAELGQQKLQEILSKAENIEKTSESQKSQVENMDGSNDEVEKRTQDIDKKIEEVKEESIKEIEAVQNEKKEINRDLLKTGSVFNFKTSNGDIIEVKLISEVQKTNEPTPREYVRVKATQGTLETDVVINDLIEKKKEESFKETENPTPNSPEVSEEQKQQAEKIKQLNAEMTELLNEITSTMPSRLNQVINSESYRKLISLNEKRNNEEKELFNIYNRYTQGHDSYRRSFSTHGLDNSDYQYIEDMKTAGASSEILKRFEEFKEKFRKPEKIADDIYREDYSKIINEDRWKFERTVADKSKEVFGEDSAGRDEFQKKYFDAYRNNFSKAYNDTIPNENLFPNTMGTIYS